MSSSIAVPGPVYAVPRVASLWRLRLRVYYLETKYEFLRLLRNPAFCLPVFLFPPAFYTFFGHFAQASVGEYRQHLLAQAITFGVMAPGMFALGISAAMDKAQGLLTLKKALPMPFGADLLAKMLMSMIFALMVSVALVAVAVASGWVTLEWYRFAAVLATAAVGVLPFCAIGLFIGMMLPGQSAPAVVNLLYIGMSIASGLWVPLNILPAAMQDLAPIWPTFHLAKLLKWVVGVEAPTNLTIGVHVLVLAAFALVCFLAAVRRR